MNVVGLARFIVNHPLNRPHKAAALGRFVRWQVASRLMATPIALPYVENTRLLASHGMTGATQNWYCGLNELDEMGFVLHSLRGDDLFLDVGANIGSYTVLAGGGVGAAVIAVEPVPGSFAKLSANIRLNDLADRVEAFQGGLSDAPGSLAFTAGLDTMNRVALPGEQDTVTVPVITLDALCGERRPRVVKIDVEGHEMSVLGGGTEVLGDTAVEAVLMETNEAGRKFGTSDAMLLERMAQFGFTACVYDAMTRTLSPRPERSENTIFVRDMAAMQARCRAAPRYRLVNGTI